MAAFASWHELHGPAHQALTADCRLPAHCAIEVYSVLTRLPPPHRAPAQLVTEFLLRRFPGPLLTCDAEGYRSLLTLLSSAGLSGGAAYDGLVAITAKRAGATLLTCDVRAVPTYERLGVTFELVRK